MIKCIKLNKINLITLIDKSNKFGHIVDIIFWVYYNIIMTNLLSSRVAFTVFGIEVYWYGVFITTGILVAFLLAFALCKRKNLSSNVPYEIIISILPLGIICARLFAVLFDNSLDITDFFAFRSGGMSILGAIIGGAIGVTILCCIKKYNFFEIADIICVVLILAQAIGRWGNFVNQELYGAQITNPSWQFFPIAVKIDGLYYEALFFYESILNLIGFVILICLFWFIKQKGVAFAGYMMFYGMVRFILEPRRQGEYILKLQNIQISRLISLFMFIIGLSVLIYIIIKKIKEKKNKEFKK